MEIIRTYPLRGGPVIYFIPFGKTQIPLPLPDHRSPHWVTYNTHPADLAFDYISHSLQNPIAAKPLHEAVRGYRKAVILISDASRLCPSYLFLEQLLDAINQGGIADACITIVIALGLHRKQTEQEIKELVGTSVFRRVQVLNHSSLPEDCIQLGVTQMGTPVEINKHVVEADFRMVTGNLEPHALAGVSGGVKALFPGAASSAAIEHNHSLSQAYPATPGDPNNAVRADMEEMLGFVPIHYLLNVVVDHERNLLGAVAGDVIEAHRAAMDLVRRTFCVTVPYMFDVVIVSPGGYPKDTQLYQAVKSLTNAASITKPGGTIILIAQCEEQYGNGILQYWVDTIQDRRVMVQKLKEKFTMGAHKIEHIDKVLNKHTVYLHSLMSPKSIELLGFQPVPDLKATLAMLLKDPATSVAVLPYGGITFPQVKVSS
ncbi:nickel-dependent lactate racemase [Paenibacillus hexagrammi]|uniref:Nickel-dependent lactate racemase n=1 Tax=Paenibacillus hexagrammi TaxID=2908839 RepID=A0ABY3SGB8_9BACL|nr:nickel-dependent lactate racemase [Paenibacillus sp. YPD9-1]UJF33083.1 nickel-dependent lactate racemase [Paenibacillus sp. YPD9-1]